MPNDDPGRLQELAAEITRLRRTQQTLADIWTRQQIADASEIRDLTARVDQLTAMLTLARKFVQAPFEPFGRTCDEARIVLAQIDQVLGVDNR